MGIKILLMLLLLILFFFGLIIIGIIGANISLEDVTLNVLSIKYVFLGVIKVTPLILIIGFILIIIKKIN